MTTEAPRKFLYVVYDFDRDRYAHEFDAFDDGKARSEFETWYRSVVRPGRWENRKVDRFYLLRVGELVDGVEVRQPSVILAEDWQVPLSYWALRWAEPPTCAEDEAWLDAEFKRLRDLDEARFLRRRNQPASAAGIRTA